MTVDQSRPVADGPPTNRAGAPSGRVVLAAVLAAAALSGCQNAGPAKGPVQIEQVRVGFPASVTGNQDAGRSRNGAWGPVYVKLNAKEAVKPGALRLVVESSDSEDSPYLYATPLPALQAGEDHLAISYVRPGSGAREVKVSVQTADGQPVRSGPRAVRDPGRDVLQPKDQLYLAVGSRLPGLRRALTLEPSQLADPAAAPREGEDADDRGARRLAFLDTVELMPDRWYGYEAVDAAVLTTGSETFVKQLLEGPAAPQRRQALGEWVRRGGKLVVSVGHNHQLAATLLEQLALPGVDRMPLIDCRIGGSTVRAALPQLKAWAAPNVQRVDNLAGVEVAALEPAPDVHVIVEERPEPSDPMRRPVMVQSSCGLGRVLLVAFDLDAPPFSRWNGEASFWHRLVTELAPRTEPGAAAPFGRGIERSELGTELRDQLETFGEVPTVSFGWVALFILVYIVLVGPLDYLLLKKVFKRLELTWITFPTIVVAVSVAAYVTAYALKGEDLRVNKIDLVEVDLHTPQVYGQSWFTLFSPRIQAYTVGLEPAFPDASVLVTAMDDPLRAERAGSQGLFTRPYEYAPDLVGVERVPIPVWATRSFTANWRAPAPGGRPPLGAELRHSRVESTILTGSIENRLPFDLTDVALFYRNRWYPAGTLPAGATFRVDNLQLGGGRGQQLARWFQDAVPPQSLLRALLWHRHEAQATGKLNSGWRHLDQQWRLVAQPNTTDVYRDEVLLVARGPERQGAAEELTAGPDAATRLWLGALPAPGAARPSLPGRMRQETLVRAYLPVRKAP